MTYHTFPSAKAVHRLLVVIGILIPVVFFAASAWQSRSIAIRDGGATLVSAVALVGDAIHAELKAEEIALSTVADHVNGLDWAAIEKPGTNAFLAHLAASLTHVDAIWIADQTGTVRASSSATDTGTRIIERTLFPIDRSDDLYLSLLYASGRDHPVSVTIIRRRPGDDGGTIHASLDPAYLKHLFADATPRPYHSVIVTSDGEIIAEPHGGSPTARLPVTDPLMRHIIATPDRGPFDIGNFLGDGNTESLFAYQRVPGYPVWIALAVDEAAVLHGWYSDVAMYGGASALTASVLLFAAWFTIRQARNELAAHEQHLTRQSQQRALAEDMLRQSRKLEAMGQLTGGLAHDFNNLLTVIIVTVEFLLDGVQDRPDLAEQAHDILRTALRGAELTRRLLVFARKQPLQPRPVELTVLLPDLVGMLRRTLGAPVDITLDLAPDVWPAFADASQIGDVLLNLALNARDAMPQGGRLTIATFNQTQDRQSMDADSPLTAGDYVVLAVSDTGTGMTAEVMQRATEPFFTTKSPSAASGLGLSMAYGFARQSRGHLELTSQVGAGTTVKLYLPRAPAGTPTANDAMENHRDEWTGLGGHEAILLVDDNPTLRAVVERRLIALGYKVLTAENGPSALAMIRSAVAIDLLLTDIVMPGGLSGYELAKAARDLRPGIRVLFMTGYADDLPDDRGIDANQGPLLRKPFRQRDLAQAIRTALRTDGISQSP